MAEDMPPYCASSGLPSSELAHLVRLVLLVPPRGSQPGGSIRDDEVIAAADEAGLTMLFAGMRPFRH